MDSYLMMLYVTLEQESALKKFFVDQGWTFCKPDLAVTTDKVGPSILPPAVQKSGTAVVSDSEQNNKTSSKIDIGIPGSATKDTPISRFKGKRKSEMSQPIPANIKQPKISLPQSNTTGSQSNETVSTKEAEPVVNSPHTSKAARSSPITVLGEDGKHFVIKVERECEELQENSDGVDNGSDRILGDSTFNDDDGDNFYDDGDDDINDDSMNLDSSWKQGFSQGDTDLNSDSQSSAGGSKGKCISSVYGSSLLQTTFHPENLHRNSMSFAQFSEDDSAGLDVEKDSSNTKRTVKRSVALFREFLGDNSTFEAFSKEALNVYLRQFFASIRKQDGSELKKSSLVSLKYGISKYLKDICNIDIQSEPNFKGCLNTFKSRLTYLKKQGKGDVQHKLEITSSDLKKLHSPDNQAFCINTPSGLQKKVWFDIMFHLCRKGQENLRSMTKHTFCVSVDSAGLKYIHQVKEEADRNNGEDAHTDGNTGEVRLYERPDNKSCPVKTFETYLSKLNPELDALWQRPLEHFQEDDTVWYLKTPVGKNNLANWMADISQQAQLSHRYTNHCIRATSTAKLDRVLFD